MVPRERRPLSRLCPARVFPAAVRHAAPCAPPRDPSTERRAGVSYRAASYSPRTSAAVSLTLCSSALVRLLPLPLPFTLPPPPVLPCVSDGPREMAASSGRSSGRAGRRLDGVATPLPRPLRRLSARLSGRVPPKPLPVRDALGLQVPLLLVGAFASSCLMRWRHACSSTDCASRCAVVAWSCKEGGGTDSTGKKEETKKKAENKKK